tara:strand:- start:54 stop:410 length:357 start_codon:yes stop_codon:yes gene_type:complete
MKRTPFDEIPVLLSKLSDTQLDAFIHIAPWKAEKERRERKRVRNDLERTRRETRAYIEKHGIKEGDAVLVPQDDGFLLGKVSVLRESSFGTCNVDTYDSELGEINKNKIVKVKDMILK